MGGLLGLAAPRDGTGPNRRGLDGRVEDADVDLAVVVEAAEQAGGEALAFVHDGVAGLQPAAAVELYLIEVVVERAEEQRTALGVEPEAALALVEQLLLDFPRGEQVDDDALGVDPEQLDQVEDERG